MVIARASADRVSAAKGVQRERIEGDDSEQDRAARLGDEEERKCDKGC